MQQQKKLLRSGFTLLFNHEDHIVRVLSSLLIYFWLFVNGSRLLNSSYGEREDLLIVHIVAVVTLTINAFFNVFLYLFREDRTIVNFHYIGVMLNTLLLATYYTFMGADIVLIGTMAFVFTIVGTSYLRYNVNSADSLSAIAAKSKLLLKESSRMLSSIPVTGVTDGNRPNHTSASDGNN